MNELDESDFDDTDKMLKPVTNDSSENMKWTASKKRRARRKRLEQSRALEQQLKISGQAGKTEQLENGLGEISEVNDCKPCVDESAAKTDTLIKGKKSQVVATDVGKVVEIRRKTRGHDKKKSSNESKVIFHLLWYFLLCVCIYKSYMNFCVFVTDILNLFTP